MTNEELRQALINLYGYCLSDLSVPNYVVDVLHDLIGGHFAITIENEPLPKQENTGVGQ